jgi:uracil-DNA glycosylase
MAIQSEDHTEDLESPSSQASVVSKDEKVVSSVPEQDEPESTKPKLAPSTSTTNGKRQRTLFDMLGSAPSQGSNTPSKKPKLTASGSSAGNHNKLSAVSSSGGSSGPQPLNSIPFSSSEYTDSLTGDQKRLLKLECETMGKSW